MKTATAQCQHQVPLVLICGGLLPQVPYNAKKVWMFVGCGCGWSSISLFYFICVGLLPQFPYNAKKVRMFVGCGCGWGSIVGVDWMHLCLKDGFRYWRGGSVNVGLKHKTCS